MTPSMSKGPSKRKTSQVNKIVLVGAGGVGKTSIAKRLVTGEYLETGMTVGLNVESWMVKDTDEDVSFKVVAFDLGGQKQFRFFQPELVSGADIALIVFDLSRYESFAELDEWLDMVKEMPAESKLLIANKCDLRPVVQEDEANALAKQLGVRLIYLSAKTGQGFDKLESMIWKQLKDKTKT